jgi:hypothetical protein
MTVTVSAVLALFGRRWDNYRPVPTRRGESIVLVVMMMMAMAARGSLRG